MSKELTESEKEIMRLDDEALDYLLHSRKGRWFLMRLLDRTYINSQTFNPENEGLTAYNEGRRGVGLEYLGMMIRDTKRIAMKQKAEKEYTAVKSRLGRSLE